MTKQEIISEFDNAYYVATDTLNTEEERKEAMEYIRTLFDELVKMII